VRTPIVSPSGGLVVVVTDDQDSLRARWEPRTFASGRWSYFRADRLESLWFSLEAVE
jgi:hypothetical protein